MHDAENCGSKLCNTKTPCCHMLSELTDTWIPNSICLTAVSKNDSMQSNKHTNLHAKFFKLESSCYMSLCCCTCSSSTDSQTSSGNHCHSVSSLYRYSYATS